MKPSRKTIDLARIAAFTAIGIVALVLIVKVEKKRRWAAEEMHRLDQVVATNQEIERAFEELIAKHKAGTATPEDIARIEELRKKRTEFHLSKAP